MKDLYRRIGVPSGADRSLLEATLAAMPEVTDRDDAAAVLLDERRKEVYDRQLAVVRRVASVRKHTGLEHTEFWNQSNYADFIRTGPTPPRSTEKDTPPYAETETPNSWSAPWTLAERSVRAFIVNAIARVVPILIVLGMIWLIGLVFNKCSGPGHDFPNGENERPNSGELDFFQNR